MNGLRTSGGPAAAANGRGDVGPGRVLDLIVKQQALTRNAIAQATGLSRSTVGQRLDLLLDAGLIVESDENLPSGGRPASVLRFEPAAGVVVCIDVGEERTRVALTDLAASILDERVEQLDVNDGPEAVLDSISATIRDMLDQPALTARPVAGLGLGLPAPVDYEAGQVRGWSIMSGWDGYDIRAHLRQEVDAPILIDNDVNLLTLAEHRRHWPQARHLFYVKVGTGVGSGMVIDGTINRGAQGAAGDIGHAHIPGYGDPVCRCGNLGCLESLVGGWALARDLRRSGKVDGHDARDVVRLIRQGDSDALAGLRAAGRVLGEAVAYATSLLNPEVIVIGGLLAAIGDDMVAGVRALIYQRALPLATRDLRILPSRFRSRAGIAGAAYLVRDFVLDPASVDRTLAAGRSPFAD